MSSTFDSIETSRSASARAKSPSAEGLQGARARRWQSDAPSVETDEAPWAEAEIPVSSAVARSRRQPWVEIVQSRRRSPRDRRYEIIKRAIDVAVASLALVIVSPLMALVALLIKLTDRGPVLYVQTRVGRGGAEFPCYKLRSMVPQADQLKQSLAELSHHTDQRTFKICDDPRVTWIGRLVRKTSLDEVPQLWNIVLGHMSLVGPRPPVPSEVECYTDLDWRRLEVLPGLTCIWQVSGRADVPFDEQVLLDIDYIQRRSLWLDFKLIAQTVPAVITGRGAY
jgi:lipopolysaccharide/colanic/teichoic acid biosynthesis glycosyltransferase